MTKLIKILVCFFSLLWMLEANAHEKEFTITTGEHGLLPIPLGIALDDISPNNDSLSINVYRDVEGNRVLLKSQLQQGDQNVLWFIPDAAIEPKSIAKFILEVKEGKPDNIETAFVSIDNNNIHLVAKDKPVLDYRHAFQEAPADANPIYGKSGFIHPLYSPEGNVLTRIQPDDHYHHYGIWNPWTKTKVEGKETDFWNLLLGEGTVRYGGLLAKTSGSVFSSFKLKQEHVNYQNKGADEVAINETWEVKSYPVTIDAKPCWIIDMKITLSNNLDSIIELTNYRYGGGIGFRATEYWTNQNSKVLTSEGKTRKDADGTFARWCKVEGAFPSGTNSGIVFFSHPDNRAHPEPMRVWPEDANNGRGDMFFEFCPIRHQKWDLLPNKEYILKYRMLVFDDELSAEIAESVWQTFAHGVSIEWNN